MDIDNKWLQIRDDFRSTGGFLVVMGDVDTGKSTFCRWLCNQLLGDDCRVYFIDCDVGQSDVGPPTCITAAVIDSPVERDQSIKHDSLHFIGSTSPVGHLLQGVVGVFRMLENSWANRATHVVVDTTGWIYGGAAVVYKQAKIDVLKPGKIVCFEKDRELAPIIKPYRRMKTPDVVRLEISRDVKPKTREERIFLRKKKFDEYFSGASLVQIKLDRVGISGLRFPITPEKVEEQVAVLIDENDRHRELGIVRNYNRKSRDFEIHTPFKGDPKIIRRIHFENFYLMEI